MPDTMADSATAEAVSSSADIVDLTTLALNRDRYLQTVAPSSPTPDLLSKVQISRSDRVRTAQTKEIATPPADARSD
jgi:hypothetical protein